MCNGLKYLERLKPHVRGEASNYPKWGILDLLCVQFIVGSHSFGTVIWIVCRQETKAILLNADCCVKIFLPLTLEDWSGL